MSGTTYNQYHYSQQETWLSILNWLDGYQYSDASRAVYELFFEHYPTAVLLIVIFMVEYVLGSIYSERVK